MPKNPRDLSFKETVEMLAHTFGSKALLFNIRFKSLQIEKGDGDDIVTHAGRVNQECQRFVQELSSDQFKCLIFVCGLKSPRNAEYRLKLLNKIETVFGHGPKTG